MSEARRNAMPAPMTVPAAMPRASSDRGRPRALARRARRGMCAARPRAKPGWSWPRGGTDMTTEVAVLNRLGVALAADSAVTISGNNKSKVFDTGDKLFELCVDGKDAVGIMINGNMHLLGVPWELLVKEYRETTRPIPPASMQGWMDSLVDFISGHKMLNEQAEKSFVESAVRAEFGRVFQRFVRSFLVTEDADPSKLVSPIVDVRLAFYRGQPASKSVAGLSRREVQKRHGATIRTLIGTEFEQIELSALDKRKLMSLALAALFSDVQTTASTGIIVAGYGAGDMFPSALVTDVDGVVCGKLRYSKRDSLIIDRAEMPGRVVSFAQTDVVERLLSGVDDRFISMTEKYISTSLRSAMDSIEQLLTGAGLENVVAAGILDDLIAGVVSKYKNDFVKTARQDFQSEFNQMIAMMPKQDVIELAEALVSITAIERNASSSQATVGGPVDIAFITKHEGFVWIKRKHYFEASLNPRYFWRKKQQHSGDRP